MARIKDGAVIDEVQRVPDLTSYLQVLVHENPIPGRVILSRSQNLASMESVNQSLAGHTALVELLPLDLEEVDSLP